MTPEERFEQIEQTLGRLATLAESNQTALGGLIGSVNAFVTSSNAFVESSNAYVQDSKARMAQIEANLDALIRAITLEHSNGKGNPPKE